MIKSLDCKTKRKGKCIVENKKWVKVKIIDEIRKKGGNIQWNGINVSAGKLSENWNREAGDKPGKIELSVAGEKMKAKKLVLNTK